MRGSLLLCMDYLFTNITFPINEEPNFRQIIKKKYRLDSTQFDDLQIVRRAIDARQKNNLHFVYTLRISSKIPLPKQLNIVLIHPEQVIASPKTVCYSPNPFIIGMGPSGLFAALKLVEAGFQPDIFEQGGDLAYRKTRVEHFWNTQELDENTNVQFGEGGAGAFSDGKLTARTHNIYTEQVFNYLIKFGGDTDLAVNANAHIGTDHLITIIQNIKNYLCYHGCHFYYQHQLQDLELHGNNLTKVIINGQKHAPEILFLAVGNSARKTFQMLHQRNLALENKPFAVGLRIEHPKDYINHAFYGEKNDFNLSGDAVYKLTYQNGHRGVYTFCMCPGGFVIPAASHHHEQVVNGMSYANRDHHFSNSALVVTVNNQDYGNHPLGAMQWQQSLESKFFHNYEAPAQNVIDFTKKKKSVFLKPNSYFFPCHSSNLYEQLPTFISSSLLSAVQNFEQKYPGFVNEGSFIGIETRTSSPVRILRDQVYFHSLNAHNLFPIGEGSGYAGGIISSAADGLKVASSVVRP